MWHVYDVSLLFHGALCYRERLVPLDCSIYGCQAVNGLE